MDKDYDYLNCKYIGSEYGNLRRERAQLQQRMILHNDASVKPRIREITAQLQTMISSRKLNDKAAKNLRIRPRLKLNNQS